MAEILFHPLHLQFYHLVGLSVNYRGLHTVVRDGGYRAVVPARKWFREGLVYVSLFSVLANLRMHATCGHGYTYAPS